MTVMFRFLIVAVPNAWGSHISPAELQPLPPKDAKNQGAWKNDIQQTLLTFDQVETTAAKLNMTVEALGERVTTRAKAIAEMLGTYAQVVHTAKEINMTAEELEAAFESRARSIDETVESYKMVERTAASMNITVEQLAEEVSQRAHVVDDVLRNHEVALLKAKKWNITVSPSAVKDLVPYPKFLDDPLPQPKTLEDLAGSTGATARPTSPSSGIASQQHQQLPHLQFEQGQQQPQQAQQQQRPLQGQHGDVSQGAKDAKPMLFVGIYTAPGEKAALRRKEIRETYWNHEFLKAGHKIIAKFVIGWAATNSPEEKELEKEIASRPSEFLRVNVNERYENLTQKTMALLKWFAQTSPAKWLLKLDDDTFPHFDEIATRLSQEQSRYVEMGMMFDCAPVLKETKWAEDPNLWNQTHFPKYMQGSGYFLSEDLIRVLAEERYEHNKKFLLHNEDAAIGVWMEMAKVANPSWQVQLKPVLSTLTGCQPGDLLSMNNQPGYMKCYWGRKMRGEKDICCYGPLNNLRQSFLQRSAVYHRQRLRVGCYPSSVASTTKYS